MATNEVHKYADWIDLPYDPDSLLVESGDPVKVGGLVGVAQAVGGETVTYTIGTMTVTHEGQSNSLEPGWMSVALTGSFLFEVTGADADTPMGTAVFFVVGDASNSSTLSVTPDIGNGFGNIIGRASDGRFEVRLTGMTF